MIGIIFSESDPASRNMAMRLVESCGFAGTEFAGRECWGKENAVLIGVGSALIASEQVDSFGLDVAYFLSKHKSAQGTPALTTHSLGNWTADAKIGGRPKELSFGAPAEMLGIIRAIEKVEIAGFERTYEATHHGPLLKTPSLFVEIGGDDNSINNKKAAERLADAIDQGIFEGGEEFSKVVVGIGGTHYPDKFTSLAIKKGYAFSHIMPRYAIVNEDGSDNLSVLEQVVVRSKIIPEAAVIEWKSMNAVIKERVVNKLGEIGLDYERV